MAALINKRKLARFILVATLLFLKSLYTLGQFPPGAGHAGTTAVFMDSAIFIDWAKTCQVIRGFVKISDTTFTYNGQNRASYGTERDALGKADNLTLSLGDGGSATLSFSTQIFNGPGFDFAVFENSLDGSFLELGFVEVSSDGVNFFRFPAVSRTQDTLQLSTFGTIDPSHINNFAGKYQVLFGTPFNLDDLTGTPGLDINHITHVRIIDVVGNLLEPYVTFDSEGNKVNDPWPTPFNTCGFDLDAVGVINGIPQSVSELNAEHLVFFNPNPVSRKTTVNFGGTHTVAFSLINLTGTELMRFPTIINNTSFDFSTLASGAYIGIFRFPDGRSTRVKLIKQ
jgi:hypothetical protein